jgi:predicted RND superfamily exporter protein
LRRFVNVERREALVLAHVSDLGTAALERLTFDLNRELDAVRARHPGFDFELSGSSIVGTAVINRLIGGLGTGLGLEAVIIFLLIASVFRSWRLGLISLIPNLFPLACMATVMSGMGMSLHFGNVITFNVCLGLAVDDTVHVLNRIVHSRSPRSIDRLIVDCMSEVGPAVFATTLILCAGFAVMLLSSVPASRTFGGLACLMMAASFVAELLLLPALLAVFGEKALRRRVERYSRESASTGA